MKKFVKIVFVLYILRIVTGIFCVYNRLTTEITLKTLMCLEIKADRLGNFEV